jgi:transcriptional regulator with XRE-family HTH domain
MSAHSSDQNGHNRPHYRFEFTRKRLEIPVEVLRDFAQRKFDRYTQRGLAAMLRLSQAAVSDFVRGLTLPTRRTITAFAKLYLVFHPEGYVEKRKVEREVVPQLKTVLPAGERAAIETVEAMIRAAEESGVFKDTPEPLRDWLTTVVAAEYDAERRYAKYERKRRPKGSADAVAEPRRRKKKPGDRGEG